MKKNLALLMAIVMVITMMIPITVSAEGEVTETVITKEKLEEMGYTTVEPVANNNDLYGWKVSDGVLDIYYTGAPVKNYAESTYTSRPWNSQAENITSVVINGTPTEIGKYTFYKMSALKNYTLSGTETVIGANAFANTSIGGVVTIPEHITKVHGQAFMNCPINVLVYDGDAETPTLWLDKGIQYLGKLTNIVIKRTIGFSNLPTESNGRTLKHFAGTYGSGTYGMTNPAKINVVSTNTIYFNSFKTITAYPDAYDVQGKLAKEDGLAPELFKDCVVADAEKTIGINKFIDNVWYLEYYEPDGSKTIEFITNGIETGSNMASEAKFTDNKKGAYKKMIWGFGFTDIPASFGTKYTQIAMLQLPATMKTIGNNAFDKIAKLERVNFEDTQITSIGAAAFRKSAIKELKFPVTIKTLSMKSFINNNSLEYVYFPKASNLILGNWAFARESDSASYAGKNLKVVFDDVTFSGSTNVDAFSADTTSEDWRTTTVIYNDSKTTSLPNFNKITPVVDKYYEISDTDNDNKVNLFVCNFDENQTYKMIMATYAGNALSNAYTLDGGTLTAGNVLNTYVDISTNMSVGNTKVFLWDGLVNIKPLTSVLNK